MLKQIQNAPFIKYDLLILTNICIIIHNFNASYIHLHWLKYFQRYPSGTTTVCIENYCYVIKMRASTVFNNSFIAFRINILNTHCVYSAIHKYLPPWPFPKFVTASTWN